MSEERFSLRTWTEEQGFVNTMELECSLVEDGTTIVRIHVTLPKGAVEVTAERDLLQDYDFGLLRRGARIPLRFAFDITDTLPWMYLTGIVRYGRFIPIATIVQGRSAV